MRKRCRGVTMGFEGDLRGVCGWEGGGGRCIDGEIGEGEVALFREGENRQGSQGLRGCSSSVNRHNSIGSRSVSSVCRNLSLCTADEHESCLLICSALTEISACLIQCQHMSQSQPWPSHVVGKRESSPLITTERAKLGPNTHPDHHRPLIFNY